MLKVIKPIAIVLIASGLLLAGLYGFDLHRSAAAAERIRNLRAQSVEALASSQEGTQSPAEPSASSVEVPVASSASSPTTQTDPDVSTNTASFGPPVPSGSGQASPDDPYTGPSTDPSANVSADPFANLRNPLPTAVKSPLSELFTENSDLVGWIRIADTRIDYPIVKGRDNIFYLSHGFDRKKSQAGAIFMDFRNIGDGNDAHTIIYGHKMKNQSMFQNLLKFSNAKFYASHRLIEIDTLYGRKTYRVFAAYSTDTDFYYIQTRFDQASHAAFIDGIQKRTGHAWDTDVSFEDRILTLSTCSSDFRDARFVVHAILIR